MFWFFDFFSYFLPSKVRATMKTLMNVTAGPTSIVEVRFLEHKCFHLLVLFVNFASDNKLVALS
jgi:hypothetical protein